LNSDTPSCDNLHGRRLGLCDFRERRCSETLAALSSAPQLAGQHDTRYHSHSRREQRRLQHHSAPGHACETRRRCARPARSPVLQQAGTWAGGRHAPKPLLPAAECVRRIPRPPALRSPAEPPRATTVGSACCQGEAHSPCAQGARGGVARSCMLGGKVKKEKQTATCWCAKGCRSQERARGHARPASGRNPFVWALAPAPVGAGARVLDENGGAPELRDETRGALQKGSRQSPGPSTPWLLRRSGIWAPREPRGLEGRRRRLGRARALPLAPAPPH
jgi:hypothetical protein